MPFIVAAVIVVLLAAGGAGYAVFGTGHTKHHAYAFASTGTATNVTQTTPHTQTSPADAYSTDSHSTTTSSTTTSSTTTSSTTTQAPPPGACASDGVRLKNGMNLSCPFARNIVHTLSACYSHGSTLSAGPARLRVSSPATGLTYSVTCSLTGRTVDCHNDQFTDVDRGNGNNDVTFPASLIR